MTDPNSITTYLRSLYEADPLIANGLVLKRIREKFPNSKVGKKALRVWKTMLRNQDVKIPYQCVRKKGAQDGIH